MASRKQRLDIRLHEQGLASSRQNARALIMAGRVRVDGEMIDKPGRLVGAGQQIAVHGDGNPYVSRGGLKLEGALAAFHFPVQDRVCLDVGASTGGFTDCLLQHGARKVYAVDVGYGQMSWKLRQDPRVVVIERTNIRHMPRKRIPEPIDAAVIDVSFISLRIIVPVVAPLLSDDGRILVMIKPQFEAGKGNVGKGGVVRDPVQQMAIVNDLCRFFADIGYSASPPFPAPLPGPKGNQEYFVLLTPTPDAL